MTSPTLFVVLALATIATAFPEDDPTVPLLSSSDRSSTHSSTVTTNIPATDCAKVVQVLKDTNAFIHAPSKILPEQAQHSEIIELGDDLPSHGPACPVNPPLKSQIIKALHAMSDLIEQDGQGRICRDEIFGMILYVISEEDCTAAAAAEEDFVLGLESLEFISQFLQKALKVQNPELCAEAVAFVPFLLKGYSDEAFRVFKATNRKEFILPLLSLADSATSNGQEVDTTQLNEFLNSKGCLHSRLFSLQKLTKPNSAKDHFMNLLGLNKRQHRLSQQEYAFCRMLPQQARDEIVSKLHLHERFRTSNNALYASLKHHPVWKQMMERHIQLETLADDDLVGSVFQSPKLIPFLERLAAIPAEFDTNHELIEA